MDAKLLTDGSKLKKPKHKTSQTREDLIKYILLTNLTQSLSNKVGFNSFG